jgi:Flp pilus assembly protein protease CpaA
MIDIIGLLNLNFNDFFTWQVIFLSSVCIFWLLFASFQDFRKREVENWWIFSLIAIVLVFRVFWSIQTFNIWPLVWGIIGLIIGFCISSALYYSRMFAAGDFKILIAIFSVLPLSSNSFILDWRLNLFLMLGFLIMFMLAGAVYGIIFTFLLSLKNFKFFKKEFKKQFIKFKSAVIFSFLLFLLAFILSYTIGSLATLLGIIIFISSILLVYAKAVEETSMIKQVKVSNLTIGDWLVNSVKISSKTIKPNWQGLSEDELKLIQKNLNKSKKILVKEGIPFVPAFLLGFIFLILLIVLSL